MLTLTALNGQDKGREFQLTGQQPELLGRQAPSIKLTDAQTSRRHAEILLENNTWLIRDLGSTNGTWVNGQKITQITELEVGDRIVMGRHQFRVSQITELPAPKPQPRPKQPEPAIGQEDLGDMGIDLSESLSADLLEEDGSAVGEVPEGAIDLDDEPPVTKIRPTAQPAAGKDQPKQEDDGLIDLDALLAEPDAPSSDGDSEPSEPKDESAEPIEADLAPAAEPQRADEDVIDLDAVLADEPAEPVAEAESADEALSPVEDEPADEAPIEIEPQTTTEAPEAPTEATQEPAASTDDDVLDIDALLAEDETPQTEPTEPRAPVVDDAGTKPEPPEPTDTTEASTEPEAEAPIADPRATADDEPFDVDAYLGLDSDDEPATPQSDDQSATGPEPEAPQPSEDVAATGDEDEASIDDLDAMLGDLHDTAGDADLEEDADDTPDREPADEAPTEPQRDSLVDIDILASAQPAEFRSDDSGLDAPADAAVLEDDGPADTEDIEDDASPATAAAVAGTAEGAEPDQDVLLSPEDQARAVAGYKRSKRLRTMLITCVILALLGVAGWLGYTQYFASPADAKSTQTRAVGPTDSTPSRPTDDATDNTDNRATLIDPSDRDDTQPTEDMPDTADTAGAPPTPRPAPEQMAPPAPRKSFDPFADIEITPRPQPETTQADTPSETEQPEADTEPTEEPEPGSTSQADPDTRIVDATPRGPTPTIDAGPTATSQALNLRSPPEPTAGPVDPAVSEPSAEASPRPAVSSDSDAVDLLTEAIEAQHAPGEDVTALAVFAGAPRIAYVVDASGSLVDNFPQVLHELNLEIAGLDDGQAFTVIFFGSDGIVEVPPAGLRWADGRNKRIVREWTRPEQGNVTAWGRGDPIQALQRAVEYNPTEVVILSDNLIGRQSTADDVSELLTRVDNTLGDEVQRVNVIQFFNRDPQQVLKSIADRFNGRYSVILARPGPDAQSAADDPLTGN